MNGIYALAQHSEWSRIMFEEYNEATTSSIVDEDENEDTVEHHTDSDVIKVSARSRSTSVAGAIAGVIRERGEVEVQAIGAGAVNQAVKAMAIARGYLERDSLDINFQPYFVDVDIDGQERTAVRFAVVSFSR